MLGPAVDPDVVLPHEENLAPGAGALLLSHDAGEGCVHEEAGIVRRLAVLVAFFAVDDDRLRVLPADVHREGVGFHPVVREIVPVLPALQPQEEQGHDLPSDEGRDRAQQRHHDAGGEEQEHDSHGVAQGRHGHQVAVAHRGQGDQGVPDRVAEGADAGIGVGGLGAVEDHHQRDIDRRRDEGKICIELFSPFHASPHPPFPVFLPVWPRARPGHRDSIASLGEKVQENTPPKKSAAL